MTYQDIHFYIYRSPCKSALIFKTLSIKILLCNAGGCIFIYYGYFFQDVEAFLFYNGLVSTNI